MSRYKKTSSPRSKAGESTDSSALPAVSQDQPVNGGAHSNTPAPRADDGRKEDPRWVKWGVRAGLVITLVSAFLGGLAWLNSRIDNSVTERIEPYEHFLLGLGAVHDEEYDRAIPDLDKAFDALEKRGGAKEQLVPLIDFYLYAIVNSEHPAKHS